MKLNKEDVFHSELASNADIVHYSPSWDYRTNVLEFLCFGMLPEPKKETVESWSYSKIRTENDVFDIGITSCSIWMKKSNGAPTHEWINDKIDGMKLIELKMELAAALSSIGYLSVLDLITIFPEIDDGPE